MDAFDLDVFGCVGNDYEAIHTIRGELERDLGRRVYAEEVAAALLRLASQGFVDAFEFDPTVNSYRRVAPSAYAPNELWFLMNARGRAEYERFAA
jgi:hypothetical protein